MEGKGRRRNAPHGAYIPGSGCRSFGCFCWIFSSSKTWLQVWRSEDDGEHHHRGRNRLFLVSRSRIPNHQTSTSLLTFYIYIYICALHTQTARGEASFSSILSKLEKANENEKIVLLGARARQTEMSRVRSRWQMCAPRVNGMSLGVILGSPGGSPVDPPPFTSTSTVSF